MTEEKLNERLAQILTHEELLYVDAYFSRKNGLCMDIYIDGYPENHLERFIHNLKVVAMGKANIKIIKTDSYQYNCA